MALLNNMFIIFGIVQQGSIDNKWCIIITVHPYLSLSAAYVGKTVYVLF